MCARLVGVLGYPLPLRSRRFQRSLRFLPVAVRRSLSQSASSPRELRSPPEFFRLVPAAGIATNSAFHGVRGSLFATSPDGVRASRLPCLGAFPSAAFL